VKDDANADGCDGPFQAVSRTAYATNAPSKDDSIADSIGEMVAKEI